MLRFSRVALIGGLLLSTLSVIWLSHRLSSCESRQAYCAVKHAQQPQPDPIEEVGFPNVVSQFGKHQSLQHEMLWDADRRDSRSYSLKLRPFRINKKSLDTTFLQPSKSTSIPTCDSTTYLLLLIPSAPSNFERREFIRSTWANELYGGAGWTQFGKQREKVQLLFLLGTVSQQGATSQRSNSSELAEESAQYGDMLLLDIMDTYRNLTVKMLAGLEYACSACQSRYVLKVDDDVFVSLPLVLAELRRREMDLVRTAFHGFQRDTISADGDRMRTEVEARLGNSALFLGASVLSDALLCAVNPNSRVHREGLWGVSPSDYPPDSWPPYCAGNAYLTSSRVVCRLSWAAHHVPLLMIEDAFITGVLVRAAGVQLVNFDSRMTRWGTRMATACDILSTGRLVATNFQLQDGYNFWQQLNEAKCPTS